MNPDRRQAILGIVLTIGVAYTIYTISFVAHVYAPGARAIQQKLASTDDWSTFLNSLWFGAIVYFVVRKTYGALAFAILGFLAAPVFARDRRIAAVFVSFGIVRVGLEIVERFHHGGDTLWESAFDVVSGTVAATLGALARNAVSRRREIGT